MLKLAANISTLFTELPLLQRPAAAAAAGFEAIEVQFPYGERARNFAGAVRAAGVRCVLLNMPAGDRAGGELGLACMPGSQDAFLAALSETEAYARELGAPQVNCLAGNIPAGMTQEMCWPVLVENVRLAAARLAALDVRLLVEVLNGVDFPRFALQTSAQGDAVLAAVAHSNLALQYDIYHRRAAGEEWLAGLSERLHRIGHVQFSDYPGRHEPGTGELDIAQLFRTLEEARYDGWVGCEYIPLRSTADSFAWRQALSPR